MDEALEIGRLAARVDRLALERELHDVVLLDAVRRPRPRQEEALRIVGVPRADMAERVDHAFGRQDAVGGDEFFEQSIELGHWVSLGTSFRGVMPGLVPGIHVLPVIEDVDGRDKPGHDCVVSTTK